MERRRRSDRDPTSPPPPPATPSPCLLDVSNYKTPRSRFQNPNPNPTPVFLSSRNRPSSAAASHRRLSKTARRLKALEIDQSRSSRKAQLGREKALKTLSLSLSAWLNSLFKNPASCGCNVGKRRSPSGEGIGADGRGRSPKRQRRCGRRLVPDELQPSLTGFSSLRASLREVCSFEDVRDRMGAYMSRKSCDEVFSMMSQICKNIDEGRLKIKAQCPIVTDLRLKEKAIKVLMCYHPMWLRVGLHIVLGGDSLLPNEGQLNEDDMFLKAIVEKQFFSHIDLAKSYAYNKLVEGLYRPGYFEALGNIILKRFLLLVISLDKAKCEIILPIEYGIDGLDGGSPLLFCRHSSIKSSLQVIHEFLLEVMHGEGDLLAHLATLGCKLNYEQSPLAEYDFNVTNLFEDLQDGILLCRAIQLLCCDPSILSKMKVPSDSRKKNMQNCSIVLQYLKQAGVTLSDGDGVLIVEEDVANGDKELTLSILWNMFVHIQAPLLINRISLVEELIRIKGSDLDFSKYNTMSLMALLLEWIQVVCERFPINVDNFSSLIDGKVFLYLIYYYVGIEEIQEYGENLIRRCNDDTVAEVHGLVISVLGNFPEVLPVGDILDKDAYSDERSLTILVVFLASRLIHEKNWNRLVPFIVEQSNYRCPDMKSSVVRQLPLSGIDTYIHKSRGKNVLEFVSPVKKERLYKYRSEEWAAIIIQSRFRRFSARTNFLKMKMATSFLQSVTRAWLAVALSRRSNNIKIACSVGQPSPDMYYRYLTYMIERYRFVKIKKSVLLIQRCVRTWIRHRHHKNYEIAATVLQSYIRAHLRRSKSIMLTELQEQQVEDYEIAATSLQSYIRGHIGRCRYLLLTKLQGEQTFLCDQEVIQCQSRAATKIQLAWRTFNMHSFHLRRIAAAVEIQRHWRGWYTRKNFCSDMGAIIKVQAGIRCLMYQRAFQRCRFAAVEIQRFIRGHNARNWLLGSSYLQSGRLPFGSYIVTGTSQSKNIQLRIVTRSVLKLQRWWKQVLLNKSRTTSIVLIQSFLRGFSARRAVNRKKNSIVIIQRWWRKYLFLKSRNRSTLTIQAYFRGWLVRRAAQRHRHCIAVIQSYCKGWLVRKAAKPQVLDLRRRLEKSSANVDDGMRLINRLVAALSELLGRRSISSIRHTCATLNMATEHSQKCCEALVAAHAIDILLKQFSLLNRGIPDQEVLRHVLCTLRNITRYPHLVHVLINTSRSLEIIFQELLRNKGEGFFIACDILKKLSATHEGFEAISKLQSHIRRLQTLVQNLEGKIELHKRNPRLGAEKEYTTRKRNVAVSLLLSISRDHQ